jgi:CRP-like cAMP-binding protein
MSTPPVAESPEVNRLLAALPGPEYDRLRPHLEPVSLSLKQVLFEPGDTITHVYFPAGSMVCTVLVLDDASMETGIVGSEGMVGLPIFLGSNIAFSRALVPSPGPALRIKAEAFRSEVGRDSALHDLLQRYTDYFLAMVSYTAACTRFHSVHQRCCYWLLMMHDRVGTDQFGLTQEFLSHMLGVRRAGVTEVARKLQQAGLIRYRWGQITMRNRPGLEAACCECYGKVRTKYDLVFPGEEPR